MRVQLRKPFFPSHSIEKIVKKIKLALKSGKLTLGENVKSLESNFAKFEGMRYASGVSSATAGLHLSLLSIGVGKDDEVIVPVKTFISTANAAIYCGAKPIFCDVDNQSFQMDPSKLKKLITKKTKAIIPVHLGGNISPMNEIMETAAKNDIEVIEDAAHAHGATLYGKKAGSFGKIGVFSFYPDKVMVSSDGGIIVTNNRSIYEKIMLLRNVGRRNIGNHDFSIIGYNYRMNEIQAILANEQLRLLPKMLKRRRKIAELYNHEFEKIKILDTQKILPGVKPSYYAYIMRLLKGNLNLLRRNLYKNGIETSPMFTTLYKTKPYLNLLPKKSKKCAISEKLDNETFTIPLHPGMKNKEVKYVIQKINNFVYKI